MEIWIFSNIWTNEEILCKKLAYGCFKINANIGSVRNKLSKNNNQKIIYNEWIIRKTNVTM